MFYTDPDANFRLLLDAVSHQIQHTTDSDYQIAKNCHTSTEFVRRQRKFISLGPYANPMKGRNEMPRRTIEIPYDDLHREYIDNGKTIKACAEIFDCSIGAIHNKMNEYGIPKRPRGGSWKKSKARNKNTNGKPTSVPKPLPAEPETQQLKQQPEVTTPRTRYLERLMFL